MEVEGFILSEVPYGDTSKIVNIFTNDGVIGCIAKGAKSLKSNLRVNTSKFTYGKFLIDKKDNNKLSLLKEAVSINELVNIKNDLLLISYLSYIVELTNQVIKQTYEFDNLYNLFINVILKMNNKLNPKVLTNIYELKVLDYLGVGINFNSCSKCGNKKDILTIDGDIGGYVCKNCFTNEFIYDDKTIKMLRMYYLIDVSSISELKISDTVINNIDRFINIYYDRYTGLYLSSKKFLNSIDKMY
ncbi:MAG: DNA repair protein RecO [Bacilli bacterium]|nr:DNA repair protein RecO [Bacilli bacterium]